MARVRQTARKRVVGAGKSRARPKAAAVQEAHVGQTARKRVVGAGKSRARAAAVNAGAEAESETESESESWLDKVDGFGQADRCRVRGTKPRSLLRSGR